MAKKTREQWYGEAIEEALSLANLQETDLVLLPIYDQRLVNEVLEVTTDVVAPANSDQFWKLWKHEIAAAQPLPFSVAIIDGFTHGEGYLSQIIMACFELEIPYLVGVGSFLITEPHGSRTDRVNEVSVLIGDNFTNFGSHVVFEIARSDFIRDEE